MDMKSLLASFSLAIITLAATPQTARAQDAATVLDIASNLLLVLGDAEQEIYFYPGQMILADGWLVEGEIAMNLREGNDFVTILLTEEEEIAYNNSEIDLIKLYNENEGFTSFTKLPGRASFSREVFRKNDSLTVYDSGYRPFTDNLRGQVFVKDGEEITNTWNFWTSSSEKDLINYLSDRDGVKYRRRDFNSLEEIFAKL